MSTPNADHQADIVLGADAAVAVGRFKPGGPDGYRARSLPNGPLRATRPEAEADERAARLSAQDDSSGEP